MRDRLSHLETQLLKHVAVGNDCWDWLGRRDKYGYGRFYGGNDRVALAHRAAWEVLVGPIPAGMSVLHRCDRPPCVRPAHLFLGTRADNNADRNAKRRQAHGVKNAHAKLTDETARAAYDAVRAGEPIGRVASRFGINGSGLYRLVTGHTWKHLGLLPLARLKKPRRQLQ